MALGALLFSKRNGERAKEGVGSLARAKMASYAEGFTDWWRTDRQTDRQTDRDATMNLWTHVAHSCIYRMRERSDIYIYMFASKYIYIFLCVCSHMTLQYISLHTFRICRACMLIAQTSTHSLALSTNGPPALREGSLIYCI